MRKKKAPRGLFPQSAMHCRLIFWTGVQLFLLATAGHNPKVVGDLEGAGDLVGAHARYALVGFAIHHTFERDTPISDRKSVV